MPTKSASSSLAAKVAKATSISRLLLALRTGLAARVWELLPSGPRRLDIGIGRVDQEREHAVAGGTNSRSSSSRFAPSSRSSGVTPVMLPPGRVKLATRPSLTGSSGVKTIGIVAVAAFAASAEGAAGRDDHGHLTPHQSAAIAGSRSYWPSA